MICSSTKKNVHILQRQKKKKTLSKLKKKSIFFCKETSYGGNIGEDRAPTWNTMDKRPFKQWCYCTKKILQLSQSETSKHLIVFLLFSSFLKSLYKIVPCKHTTEMRSPIQKAVLKPTIQEKFIYW